MDCGIYMIKNTVNDKRYFGSSFNVGKRILQHKINLCDGTHHNPLLQAEYKRYGAGAFLFNRVKNDTPAMVRWRELDYINKAIVEGQELYNLPSIKDQIVWAVTNEMWDLEVDRRVRIGGKWYKFNIVVENKFYISLRDSDHDPEKSAKAYKIKSNYVDGAGGEFQEWAYRRDMADDDVARIVREILSFTGYL